ncbi:MAG: EamA family transporter [Candidatus Neomarinimicrobiota bacterium]|nr:EamA family transporter [Candidatus Neomarinimicrobiota bacterium]
MKYLVLVSILWSFSFGIIKYGLSEVDPLFVSYGRSLIALLFFSSISIYQLKRFRWDINLIAIGAIQFGLMYIFYIQSYQYLPAYLIATFTITTPIFVSIADKYFFRKDRTSKNLLAIFLVLLGSYLMRYNIVNPIDYWSGFMLIQCANFVFAWGQVWFKQWNIKNKDTDIISNFSQLFLGATAVTSLSYFFISDNNVQLTDINLLALLFLGLCATGIGFLLWNIGASKVSSYRLAVSNNLVIPMAILNSMIFFGESINFLLFFPGIILFYVAYRLT